MKFVQSGRQNSFTIHTPTSEKARKTPTLTIKTAHGIAGAAEDTIEIDGRKLFETNFWGPQKVIQAVLSYMRERRAGTIVNISSVGGFSPLPAASLYCASKSALEAYSESPAIDLASFNIKVSMIEPSALRTRFQNAERMWFADISEHYKRIIVEQVSNKFAGIPGNQAGDSVEAAMRIFEMVTATDLVGDMSELIIPPLGTDVLGRAFPSLEQLQEEYKGSQEVADSIRGDE